MSTDSDENKVLPDFLMKIDLLEDLPVLEVSSNNINDKEELILTTLSAAFYLNPSFALMDSEA
eukprot:14658147-Ditylum_brightwellii.AAC.1